MTLRGASLVLVLAFFSALTLLAFSDYVVVAEPRTTEAAK
jgi:hypothetical protein